MMLDPKMLKENPQAIVEMLKKRNLEFPIKDLTILDTKRRQLIIELQELKHQRNIIADLIANKKKNKENSVGDEINQMKKVGDKILQLEKEQATVESKFMQLMMTVPNLIHESVPIGNSESENVVLRYYKNPGEKRELRI